MKKQKPKRANSWVFKLHWQWIGPRLSAVCLFPHAVSTPERQLFAIGCGTTRLAISNMNACVTFSDAGGAGDRP